ncbi:MAG TPA: hypothetical protein DCQ31_06580, partial [Bacteroidales bacterium]|nr:hypothetical protein [Bacteroidales bacterium]
WWGPNYYTRGAAQGRLGYEKPAFWFNPFFYLENFVNTSTAANLIGDVHVEYKIMEGMEFNASVSTNRTDYTSEYRVPSLISNSGAPELYNAWSNSFGQYNSISTENNINASLKYKKSFGDIDMDVYAGANRRYNDYSRVSTQMQQDAKSGGLILPDVYLFSNAGTIPTTGTNFYKKQVASMYGKFSAGYKNMAYLDATYRQDYSSALPSDKNGYGYPSVGGSFIFSELIGANSVLSFGKVRAGWAQVGNDVAANLIDPTFPISGKPYLRGGTIASILMYTNTQKIDPNLKPALNTSIDAGFDLKFFYDRVGLNFTYYNESRVNEIIPISMSRATGLDTYLTNAGKSQRSGVEISLNLTPVKTSDFVWDMTVNYGQNTTEILELPGDLKSMAAPGGSDAFAFVSVIHELGNEWGQLRGSKIKRNAEGKAIINADGLYEVEQAAYLGSVLPDFTGGIFNNFSYKGIRLAVAIDFQKGGKFFSLSEQWGNSSGLLEETAAINDKGKNVREDVADGGGVHVVGVDASGAAVDMYTPAYDYFTQWYGNRIADNFVHDASFIKLRDISLSYDLPKSLFGKSIFRSASVGVVARNLWLIAVAKDNVHGWDPSEMAATYGESGQLPGTRSYGFNVKLTF